MHSGSDSPAVEALEVHLTAFIRAFGLHQVDLTPCGQPLSVSDAHALMDLALYGPLAQHELGQRLYLEKSTISRLVKGLESRGWLVRLPHPSDGRAQLLGLTDAGAHLAQQVHTARRLKFVRLLAALNEAERSAVLAALNTLVEALHATTVQASH